MAAALVRSTEETSRKRPHKLSVKLYFRDLTHTSHQNLPHLVGRVQARGLEYKAIYIVRMAVHHVRQRVQIACIVRGHSSTMGIQLQHTITAFKSPLLGRRVQAIRIFRRPAGTDDVCFFCRFHASDVWNDQPKSETCTYFTGDHVKTYT